MTEFGYFCSKYAPKTGLIQNTGAIQKQQQPPPYPHHHPSPTTSKKNDYVNMDFAQLDFAKRKVSVGTPGKIRERRNSFREAVEKSKSSNNSSFNDEQQPQQTQGQDGLAQKPYESIWFEEQQQQQQLKSKQATEPQRMPSYSNVSVINVQSQLPPETGSGSDNTISNGKPHPTGANPYEPINFVDSTKPLQSVSLVKQQLNKQNSNR